MDKIREPVFFGVHDNIKPILVFCGEYQLYIEFDDSTYLI